MLEAAEKAVQCGTTVDAYSSKARQDSNVRE